MKKFMFFLILLPFLLSFSNSNAVTKKVKMTGNSCIVNFAPSTDKVTYNYIMPDTTTNDTTTTPADTLIKS